MTNIYGADKPRAYAIRVNLLKLKLCLTRNKNNHQTAQVATIIKNIQFRNTTYQHSVEYSGSNSSMLLFND